MALTKGNNSFVNLSEADSYFEDRLDVAAWSNADDEFKEQALVTASLILDEKQWKGQVVDSTQALAFPRTNGIFHDASRGIKTAFDSTYVYLATDETESSLARDIRLIRKATYELAYHLLNNDGLLDSTGQIRDIKVGPISLSEIQEKPLMPRNIRNMIAPMLNNSGRSWEGY